MMARSSAKPWAAAAVAAVLAASSRQSVLPLASAFVSPQTSIITPHLASPGIKSAVIPHGAAAATMSTAAKARRYKNFADIMDARMPAYRSLLYPERASAVSGGVPSRTSSAAGSMDSPLWMSTAEVEVGNEGAAGAGDATTAIDVDGIATKKDLMNQVDLVSSSKKRTEVNELMLKLEPMNPTESPAKSLVLNGVWEFLYTGGKSPGTLAVQVLSRLAKTLSVVFDIKAVTLTIKRDQPRVESAVKASIFGTEAQVKVRTRLEERSDIRLLEVYEEAEVAGVKIPIPVRIQPRRNLFVTYLDDDIVIARDDSGAPDLLIRKEKEFRFNTGTPSTFEDDASPGSG